MFFNHIHHSRTHESHNFISCFFKSSEIVSIIFFEFSCKILSTSILIDKSVVFTKINITEVIIIEKIVTATIISINVNQQKFTFFIFQIILFFYYNYNFL